MKPQQLSVRLAAAEHALQGRVCRTRASLPTLAAIAVAIASSVLLTLGGCASSAGIAPVAHSTAPAAIGLTEASTPSLASPIGAEWWHAFGDPALDALVERALAGNPGVKVAQARLARADAALASSKAADGPLVVAGLDATRELFSANSIYPPPLGGSIRTLGNAQIGAGWELDLFGRNKALIEASVGVQHAAQAEVQVARLVLASSVASGYVQLGRWFEQREVAVRALKQREETLVLINQRVQAGLDTAVEQRQGEGALPETRQVIEQLDEQIALTRHALAALTAQAPNALDSFSPRLSVLQAVPLPASLPADLLARRADITAARWRIEAATSDTQAARAQFYPNVNLSAFIGFSSIGLDRLFRSSSEQWGVTPAIHLPIFDSGRLRANLRVKTADLDAAIESYNGAVLDAVHDAADQISSMASLTRQQAEQTLAHAAAESAYDLATQRYKAGLGTYLTVLNAESNVLNQRRLTAAMKARALDAQIGLIRALGGGYAGDAELAARATASTL